MSELNRLAIKYKGHLIIEKCLWLGDIRIEINHIDNDLSKPLNFLSAFQKLDREVKRLGIWSKNSRDDNFAIRSTQ
jgi:hypothetical protein